MKFKIVLSVTTIVFVLGCVAAQANKSGQAGRRLWMEQTGGPVISSPGIGADGTIYVGSYDKNIYALDGKTGDELWKFQTEASIYSSPVIGADGTVYLGSDKIYALNGKTGKKKMGISNWWFCGIFAGYRI